MNRPNLVYWHRDLPPLDEEPDGEHVVQARSAAVPCRFDERDQVATSGLASLRAAAEERLVQEVVRLGGVSAHVIDEEIEVKHDEASGTAWLVGTYTYVLFVKSKSV